MKKAIYPFAIGLTVVLMSACGNKMTFEDQIKQDVYEKISKGFCEGDSIPKGAEIKNLQIGEITPIGTTGMIDVSLEFDVVNTSETKHMKKAMLYLENRSGGSKKLAIFCDYDYRESN